MESTMETNVVESILTRADTGQTPEEIASTLTMPLEKVQTTLLVNNRDWVPPREDSRGRPPRELLVGQAAYTERAFRHAKLPHQRISLHIRAAATRVRRHLLEYGLYTPRHIDRSELHDRTVQAVAAYLMGDKVIDICATFNIGASELYKALHRRGIPLRTKGGSNGR